MQVGLALEIIPLQADHVHQHLLWSRFACEGRERHCVRFACQWLRFYDTGHGSAFQISEAYWAMARSLENFPELATFRIALCAHAPGSAYNAPSWSCAWQ